MILDSNTYEKFGYYPKDILQYSTKPLILKCDFCGVIYEKLSRQVFIRRRNSKSEMDCCGNIKCVVEKRKIKFIKNWGVDNPSKSQIIKTKVKNTNLERHGGTGHQSKTIKSKIENTCLEKYGVKNPFQSKDCMNKSKETCLRKYGTNYASQDKDFRKRVANTFLEKYGVNHYQKTDECKKRVKNTCIKKYGGFTFQSEELNKKVKQTNLKKHGSESYVNPEKAKRTCFSKYGVGSFFQTDEFKKLRKETNIRKYGMENPILMFSRKSRGKKVSKIQQNIFDVIKLKFPTAKLNFWLKNVDLFPDIIIQNKKIIVEVNGDYWHCNPRLYKEDYHHGVRNITATTIWSLDEKRKQLLETHGYTVMEIWESDWNKCTDKQEFITNLFKNCKVS